MVLKKLLLPNFLKRLDHYLLVSHITIWETKLHFFLFYGPIIALLLWSASYFAPYEFPQNIPSPALLLYSSIILLFVCFVFFLFYLNNQWYKTKKHFNAVEVIQIFLIYIINSVFIFALPVMVYVTLVKNIEKKISWVEIEFFSVAMSIYNHGINDVIDYANYSSNKPANSKGYDCEFLKNYLLNRNTHSNNNVQKKLTQLIFGIDCSLDYASSRLDQDQLMMYACQNSLISKSISDALGENFIPTTPSESTKTILWLKNQYDRIENDYKNKINLVDDSILYLLTIFFIWLSSITLLLSRGYANKNLNISVVVLLTSIIILVLSLINYILYTIVDRADSFVYNFTYPFVSLPIFTLLFLYKLKSKQNSLFLLFLLLSLVFCIPLLFYNKVNDRIDFLYKYEAAWWDFYQNEYLLFLMFISYGISFMSIFVFNYLNLLPKSE